MMKRINGSVVIRLFLSILRFLTPVVVMEVESRLGDSIKLVVPAQGGTTQKVTRVYPSGFCNTLRVGDV